MAISLKECMRIVLVLLVGVRLGGVAQLLPNILAGSTEFTVSDSTVANESE